MQRTIKFNVGEVQYSVLPDDVTPETTLVSYLREKLHLTATKKMCLEGGCGCCVVAVMEEDPQGNKRVFAVNSCLVSIFSCHGWQIHTNEGIGNPVIGLHEIQKVLASNGGSQCGFCSSGMVMNMYALQESGKTTMMELENSFGGNICRCTGYRPILTAFKSLASDSNDLLEIDDVEDCSTIKCMNCPKLCKKLTVLYDSTQFQWMKVYNVNDLLEILSTSGDKRYMLVAGNTARGVYHLSPETTPQLYIDITAVEELTKYSVDASSLILGANISLSETMKIFREIAKNDPNFSYLAQMADHIDLVAHVPVRNIGTIAGNLMIKYQHNEFPSDVFLILETVNAKLKIVDLTGNEILKTPNEFLDIEMRKRVIKEVILQPYGKDYYYTSYKIMPRAQNAHAMVNCGFLIRLDVNGVVQLARIVYGAINPHFVHASATEVLLKGRELFTNDTLQNALKSLNYEVNPDWILPDPSPQFRKKLALNLFYKMVLRIAPTAKLSPKHVSGAELLTRPLSNGTQQIYPDASLFPLTKPIVKVEALAQTSGQAQYIIDIPDLPLQLHSCFVKAQSVPGSKILSIDATDALKFDGVVAFYTAKDVPGVNNIAVASLEMNVYEEVFCSGTVRFFSQPVGIIVANSHEVAVRASKLVRIHTTSPTIKPLFTVQEVLAAGEFSRLTHNTAFPRKTKGTDIKETITGHVNVSDSYHYHMEDQTCLTIPTEDGLDVFASTQWMDHSQGAIAQFLGMSSQRINMIVRRIGGAFGAKITRNAFVGCAVSLAANKLNKPVRMWMEFSDNMDIIGMRYPLYVNYTVSINGIGKIQYLEATLYSDQGVGGNESGDSYIVEQFTNCYNTDTWGFDTYSVQTDRAATCWMRAPGTFESFAAIESIMDHIAYELKLDPVAVRDVNMDTNKNAQLASMWTNMKQSQNVEERKANILEFNKNNRWKKRGISMLPMSWFLEIRVNFTTLVSIYHLDGGVAIHHGGIEIGQGINTKVAQVCAYKFGISLDKVQVKPSYNAATPNSTATGGSVTTEAALLRACDILLERMKPIKDKYPNASWEELVKRSFDANINLSSNGFYTQDEPGVKEYYVFGVVVLEVEVDILTGKWEILQADILEDVGQSMSPLIDIGQVEGAFIMGLGNHSMEELIYSPQGELLTNRTWTYKPPGAKDIPQKFNISFVDKSYNPVGVLKSKAIAEPPTCLTMSFPLAIRHALASARMDVDPSVYPFYFFDRPTTVEDVLLNTLTDYEQLAL